MKNTKLFFCLIIASLVVASGYAMDDEPNLDHAFFEEQFTAMSGANNQIDVQRVEELRGSVFSTVFDSRKEDCKSGKGIRSYVVSLVNGTKDVGCIVWDKAKNKFFAYGGGFWSGLKGFGCKIYGAFSRSGKQEEKKDKGTELREICFVSKKEGINETMEANVVSFEHPEWTKKLATLDKEKSEAMRKKYKLEKTAKGISLVVTDLMIKEERDVKALLSKLNIPVESDVLEIDNSGCLRYPTKNITTEKVLEVKVLFCENEELSDEESLSGTFEITSEKEFLETFFGACL